MNNYTYIKYKNQSAGGIFDWLFANQQPDCAVCFQKQCQSTVNKFHNLAVGNEQTMTSQYKKPLPPIPQPTQQTQQFRKPLPPIPTIVQKPPLVPQRSFIQQKPSVPPRLDVQQTIETIPLPSPPLVPQRTVRQLAPTVPQRDESINIQTQPTDLLGQIRQGHQLKKTIAVPQQTYTPPNELASTLEKAIDARRQYIKDDEETDVSDEWQGGGYRKNHHYIRYKH